MMASPQWNSYQPPCQDPAILAFHRGGPTIPDLNRPPPPINGAHVANGTHVANGVSTTSNANMAAKNHVNNSIRETGIVEKLLHSYGFLQCLEREARLFFHYSEYAGSVETMKIGDQVEFQMSFDRKTGKPIACAVVKLINNTVTFEVLSEDQVTGTVAQEATAVNKASKTQNVMPNQDNLGRVTYEQKGECFFLPFGIEDVEDSTVPQTGDEVAFYIATDKSNVRRGNGNIRARKLRLLKPVPAERFEGVVCSMKDTFGFIERSDMVREIFFHYSEFSGNINELMLGDDVDFAIQARNGKEVATSIARLSAGTVIFEDVGVDKRRGKVQKTLRTAHGRRQSDPLAGRIVYETVNGPIEIQYGDKDQKGDYTLHAGDLVEFNIATDRRDKLQRATSIALVEDTFKVNGEKREGGVIATLKDGFGFITCAERDARMFFHFSEFLDPDKDIKIGEEVDFHVIQDPTAPNRQIAIRIVYLPKGSISMETIHPVRLAGNIEKEAVNPKSEENISAEMDMLEISVKGKDKDQSPGIIIYDVNGTKQTIPYFGKIVIGNWPKLGDKVEFQISESRKNNTKTAVNVKVLTRSPVAKSQGFIATLKDNFGFIESAEHDKEVFFHFSAFEGEASDLELGDEVEYTLSRKMAKVSAESLRKLPKGSVAPEEIQPGVCDGKVVRCMRIINPDQDEYPGLVQLVNGEGDNSNADSFTYGITSLADKRDFLQQGDVVKFQVAVVKSTGKKRATNIAAVRKYVRAKVDSVKGQFGFLTHEVEEGKKLFFHMTEVHDGIELSPGDEVEFVVVHNQRNGKYSAVSLRRLQERQRPERLMSRLKSVGQESEPKVVTIRQPKGPDGTKGFTIERKLWKPPPEVT